MNKYLLMLSASSILAFFSCNSNSDQLKTIEALEQRFAAQYTPQRSDSLVNMYRDLVKSAPEDHANNLKYLTRAAEIQFTKRAEGVAAARWLDDAMVHHAKGNDITDAIALYARIYNNYYYKSAVTYKLDPKDVTKMQNHLMDNTAWLDTALTRMDRQMTTNGMVTDKPAALKFIEIAEGYASITKSNDKYADLLSQAGGLAKTIEEFNKAIQLYFRLSDRLPEHPKARTALFLQGFIYENDLKNLDKAKTTYEEFLKKYPNDTDYADDIRMALKTLGKTPEEIINGFKK